MRLQKLGREELARWLNEPVDHMREVRSLLLLKLVLLERAGLIGGRCSRPSIGRRRRP
jgi:DNA-binding PadR family transcriptional regulator